MGGTRKWFDEHNVALKERFHEFHQLNDASGWDATKGQDLKTLKKWYKQTQAGDLSSDWKMITMASFKTNAKKKSAMYVHTHRLNKSGGGNEDAHPDGASGETEGDKEVGDGGESDGETEVDDDNVSEDECGSLHNEDVIDEVQSEIEFQHPISGKRVPLLYYQWMYDIADSTGVKTTKIAILMASPSGWYASLKQEKGDFFGLKDDGKDFRLSLTGCQSINDPECARALLTDCSGIFGHIYSNSSPNVQPPAVSTAQESYVEEALQPVILEFPLMNACSRVLSTEGLKTTNSTGQRMSIQDDVPQVCVVFTQQLSHIELCLSHSSVELC